MKLKEDSINLRQVFGGRVVTLNTGAAGLRGGLRCLVRSVEGDSPMMDFIASDNTLDRYNEVIDQNGWQLENFRANPVIPDCHDYSSIARILGRAASISVEGGKLRNRVEFATDNPLGLMAFKMAKGGFIKSQSVGFIPIKWTDANKPGDPWRTYTSAELLEVSLVVVPANPGATVGLALKAGAIERMDLRRALDFLEPLCVKDDDGDMDNESTEIAKCMKCGGDMTCPKCMAEEMPEPPPGTQPKHFCSDHTAARRHVSASATGRDDAQLLRLAKGVSDVLGLK